MFFFIDKLRCVKPFYRREEAESVYQKGIKKSARPVERLKSRYREFQIRGPLSSNASSATGSPSQPSTKTESSRAPAVSAALPRLGDNSSSSSKTVGSFLPYQSTTFNSTVASRYATMLAPPVPGKRLEKIRCNMSLLWTDEGVEYSVQEARARSMGLMGKKWGPPPVTELNRHHASTSSSSSSSSFAMMDFNDDRIARLKSNGRKSLFAGAEPTVTINTKEALADVFGMYNSPDKTLKFVVPGSKHAPLKKVEPVTPVNPPKITFLKENEKGYNAKTPNSGRFYPPQYLDGVFTCF
jgi:checkpoint serine/threonine-protein kinase